MHTRTRSEYKSFVDSVCPKPNFCQSCLSTMSGLLFDANTDSGDVICMLGRDLSTNHSGDVICIQGRDPSTNHLWLCLSKTQYLSALLPKCVMITVWCHHRHSGDVICIQGRDLSTNHLLILFISKTLLLLIALLQSAPYVKMCYDYSLMPTLTV